MGGGGHDVARVIEPAPERVGHLGSPRATDDEKGRRVCVIKGKTGRTNKHVSFDEPNLPAYIEGLTVYGVSFHHVIADTGSCTSIVSLNVLKEALKHIPVKVRPDRLQVDVRSVEGNALVFVGRVTLPFMIG